MTTVSPPQTQINSVITLYSNGQVQEALDSVEVLIKDYPNEALLHNISGAFYQAIGQLNESVMSFKKAITINSKSPELFNYLGHTLSKLNNLAEANLNFKKALELDSNSLRLS